MNAGPETRTPSSEIMQELSDLRAQLQEECNKRKHVQQQLLAEQGHFAEQLRQIQEMTKGVRDILPFTYFLV
jgi:hypothetical protein